MTPRSRCWKASTSSSSAGEGGPARSQWNGKSTILRLATGELSPQRGTVRPGNNVTLAYQDQQLARLDDSKPSLGRMDATGFDAPEARDLLGAFLFSGEDVFKKVRSSPAARGTV